MKRLIVEFPTSTLMAIGFGDLLHEWWVVDLHVVHHDRRAITAVLRIRPRRSDAEIQLLASHPLVKEMRFLRTEGDVHVVLGVFRVPPRYSQLTETPGLIFERFARVGNGRFCMSLVGEGPVLHGIVERAKAAKLGLAVVKIEDVDTEPHSLRALTRQQQIVLRTAFEMGFFDAERKARLDDIARVLQQGRSSVMGTLRRAQRNLIESALRDPVLQ